MIFITYHFVLMADLAPNSKYGVIRNSILYILLAETNTDILKSPCCIHLYFLKIRQQFHRKLLPSFIVEDLPFDLDSIGLHPAL